MTRVHTKVAAHRDALAPGLGEPLIKPRSIDDVPILALTLWSPTRDPQSLRQAAAALRREISAVPDVSETDLIGGRRRMFRVELDPAQLTARRLTPLDVERALGSSNLRLSAGHVDEPGRALAVETDAWIRSSDDLKRVVLGVS